jgi:hypothetical protein
MLASRIVNEILKPAKKCVRPPLSCSQEFFRGCPVRILFLPALLEIDTNFSTEGKGV